MIALTSVVLNSVSGTTVYAGSADKKTDFKDMVATLTEAGYSEETAEALDYDDMVLIYESIKNENEINITTCAFEADNLSDMEEFLNYEEEELLSMGLTQEEIEETNEQLEEILSLEDCQLEEVYGMDETEIKMLRMVEENANSDSENDTEKVIENEVVASGSISSSKLTYTQTVVKNSTTLPNYKVTLSYAWSSPYFVACFSDKIVVGWGGNLNCKNYSGTANYYGLNLIGSSWNGGQLSSKSMSAEVSPNIGIQFSFKQYNGYDKYGNGAKSKNGSASFTLYQTKKQGYDTTLVSVYCHRVVSIQSAGISFSSSGVSVSLSIGGAWDQSSQKKTTVGY